MDASVTSLLVPVCTRDHVLGQCVFMYFSSSPACTPLILCQQLPCRDRLSRAHTVAQMHLQCSKHADLGVMQLIFLGGLYSSYSGYICARSDCRYLRPVCLTVPPPCLHDDLLQAMEKIKALTLLSDIFPTGYHGCIQAGVQPGKTVYVCPLRPWGVCHCSIII